MKVIVLGDIHGHKSWKNILERECGDYDLCVFLGDYFDNFNNTDGKEQAANFEEILKLKKDNPEKYILIYGNHDNSYYNNEQCSGYRYENCLMYNKLLKEADDNGLINLTYIHNDFLFSHAGVSEWWMDNITKLEVEDLKDLKLKHVNLNWLDFNYIKGGDFYGDSISQSPIWTRPNALTESITDGKLSKYTQIVGHTHTNAPRFIKEFNIWLNDCLPTYYLKIVNDKPIIVVNE